MGKIHELFTHGFRVGNHHADCRLKMPPMDAAFEVGRLVGPKQFVRAFRDLQRFAAGRQRVRFVEAFREVQRVRLA